MRVVHIVRSLEIGGLERVVYELVLANRAQAPAVVCLTTLGPLGEQLRDAGINIQVIGLEQGRMKALWRLRRCLRSLRPTLLHCHNLLPHLYGGLVAKVCGKPPVVLTKHGILLPAGGLSWRLNRRLMRRSHVVAVSREIESLMETQLGPGGCASLHYIPNGISVAAYATLPERTAARRALGWPIDAPLLGIVARLAEGKGYEDLFEAFARVRQSFPKARLIVAGDGPLRQKLLDVIRGLSLTDAVEMLGERHDIPHILAALDVFVLASHMEGVPMTILEAMAAGLPVVATNVGGIPQVVTDGKTGLLVDPRAPDKFADATIKLLQDPSQARRLGDAGRQRVAETFDVHAMAAGYERLYRTLVAGSRSAL